MRVDFAPNLKIRAQGLLTQSEHLNDHRNDHQRGKHHVELVESSSLLASQTTFLFGLDEP